MCDQKVKGLKNVQPTGRAPPPPKKKERLSWGSTADGARITDRP